MPDSDYVNPRGIPQAPFVDNVEEYVKTRDQVEPMIKKFDEMMSKYQYMEGSTKQRLASIKTSIPDMEKTLDMVKFLKTKKGTDEKIETSYELNDTLYAKALVTPSDKVSLWLGANVMLEYPIDEAVTLLESKLSTAKQTESTLESDLEFLRENITTMQVNIARLYNYDVQKRREEASAAGVKSGETKA